VSHPAFFTRSHAVITNGKRVQVTDEKPYIQLRAGNEMAEQVWSLDQRAAEHLYRALEARLTFTRVPDHDPYFYEPGIL
jgi:hypothetical protein